MPEIDFKNIIHSPAALAEVEVEQLKDWVAAHPHVPIFRVMLAVKCIADTTPDAARHLEDAAFFVQDRRQLKKLTQIWQDALAEAPEAEEDIATEIVAEKEEKTPEQEADIYATLEALKKSKQKAQEAEQKEPELEEIPEKPTLEDSDALKPEEEVQSEDEITETLDNPEERIEEPTEEITAEKEVKETEESSVEKDVVEHQAEAEVREQVSESSIEEEAEEEIADKEEEAIHPESTEVEEETSDINLEKEQSDEDFLRAIGKWEDAPDALHHEIEAEDWELEPPGNSLPVINGDEVVDSSLAQDDISWLLPWIDEIQPLIPVNSKPISKTSTTSVGEQKPRPEEIPDKETKPSTHENKAVNKNKADVSSSSYSFEEWLTILSKQKNEGDEDAPVFELPQPDYINTVSPPTVEEQETKKEDPENSTKKEDTTDVKKMAEDSVTMQADVATETLAKIYVNQGKKQQAIQVYEKLMKNFPEKSSYFAARIKSLKG